MLATDNVNTNKKNVVNIDNLTEPIIGKAENTAENNKLTGLWLSTTAKDFGVFGHGQHSFLFHFHLLTVLILFLRLFLLCNPPTPFCGHF